MRAVAPHLTKEEARIALGTIFRSLMNNESANGTNRTHRVSIRKFPESMFGELWAVRPNPTPHGMPIVGKFSNRDVPMSLRGLLEPDQVLVAARVAEPDSSGCW